MYWTYIKLHKTKTSTGQLVPLVQVSLLDLYKGEEKQLVLLVQVSLLDLYKGEEKQLVLLVQASVHKTEQHAL